MKINLALFITLAISVPVILPLPIGTPAAKASSAYSFQTIVVRNSTELVAAIGPNRTIVLKPNSYHLAPSKSIKANPYFEFSGPEKKFPTIKNVANLTLMGTDVRATKILTADTIANVLTFENSQNIRIQSLEIGHIPQSTAICLGAVLAFYNSKYIQINDVNLFGSGTFGLWLEKTRYLTMKNSVIKECSQGVVFLDESKQINLADSIFVNNDGGINLWKNSEILLQRIQMQHNHAEKSKDYSKALFNAKAKSKITVMDSILTDNSGQSLVGEGKTQTHFWRNYMYRNRYTPL